MSVRNDSWHGILTQIIRRPRGITDITSASIPTKTADSLQTTSKSTAVPLPASASSPVPTKSSSAVKQPTPNLRTNSTTVSATLPTITSAPASAAASTVAHDMSAASQSSSAPLTAGASSPSPTSLGIVKGNSAADAAKHSDSIKSSPSSSTSISHSPALIAGISLAIILGILLISFATIFQRRRRLKAERIRVAQNQISRFPGLDKDNHKHANLPLPFTSASVAGDTDGRYPKVLTNNQITRLSVDLEKSAMVNGHNFMADYPPTMYREHSADLKDAQGEDVPNSPAECRSSECWKEPCENETAGAYSNYDFLNEGRALADFIPSQPPQSDFSPAQSIRVFDPPNMGCLGSPVQETYPSSPSNAHGNYYRDSNHLDSFTDCAGRRSHGLTYLSTFRSPYSASSCSQASRDTEGMALEAASDEHVLSAQFPVNFSPVALEPLAFGAGPTDHSARSSRDSQATVIPRALPFPGSA